MSKYDDGRKSIVRKGAGRAFLRFLIWELVLLVICSAVYLFVLQGKVDLSFLRRFEKSETPVVESDVTETPSVEPDAVTTIEPTAEPTEAPTPVPTSTPVPTEKLAGKPEDPMESLAESHDPDLKLGLRELRLFDEAEQNVVVVRGYAYIDGADAAKNKSWLLLADAFTGEMKGMYEVAPDSEGADLSFDESAGINLDQAFFQMNFDAAALQDGYYLLCAAVQNNGVLMWNYLDSSIFHFSVSQGQAALVE